MASDRIPPAPFGCGLVLLACVMAAGCGHKPDLPPMEKVSGTVTLDGTPLGRGTVQFVPDESRGTNGPPGVGHIDENGHYEIITAGVEGAVVGHHKIGVKAEGEYDETKISMGPSLIPRQYNNPDASRLTAEVKEGQKNDIPLRLTTRR